MTTMVGTPMFGVDKNTETVDVTFAVDYNAASSIDTFNTMIGDISLGTITPIYDESGYQIGEAGPLFGSYATDTITTSNKYNYREDNIINELKAYIEKTYKQHYAAKDIQTIDVWQSLGIEKESCQSNVLKYAMRYGKKGGYNKDDLLKILHYTVLWWHFTQPKD